MQRALADTLAEVDRRLRELWSFRNELAALVQRSTDLTIGERRDPTARIYAIVEEAPVPATADRRGSRLASLARGPGRRGARR